MSSASAATRGSKKPQIKSKLELLEEWQEKLQNLDDVEDALDASIMPSIECPLYQAMWAIESAYTRALSILVGDKGEWLSWYRYENDFGKNKMQAGYDNKLKPITNLKELLAIIEFKVPKKSKKHLRGA